MESIDPHCMLYVLQIVRLQEQDCLVGELIKYDLKKKVFSAYSLITVYE